VFFFFLMEETFYSRNILGYLDLQVVQLGSVVRHPGM